MALLDLTPDELLTTTRAVRKRLDFDRPVEPEVIKECLNVAIQAPTGSNAQSWHFVVVTDKAKREAISEIYRKAFDLYRTMPIAAGNMFQDDPSRAGQQNRVMDSAEFLAANMHRIPVLVIPCIQAKYNPKGPLPAGTHFASLYPAAWSFMLAARARGLGTSLTTLHLMYEEEVATLLGIPYDTISQGMLIPTGYTKGTDFKPSKRIPLDQVVHFDGWNI